MARHWSRATVRVVAQAEHDAPRGPDACTVDRTDLTVPEVAARSVGLVKAPLSAAATQSDKRPERFSFVSTPRGMPTTVVLS